MRVVVHRPREGVQRASEATGAIGGSQSGGGVMREGGVDRRGLVHRGPVGGHEAGEGGVGGRQRGSGRGRRGTATQDVVDVEGRRVSGLQQRRGCVQRYPHGGRRRGPRVRKLHSCPAAPWSELPASGAALHLFAPQAPGDRLQQPRGGAVLLSLPAARPCGQWNGPRTRLRPCPDPPPPAQLPPPRRAGSGALGTLRPGGRSPPALPETLGTKESDCHGPRGENRLAPRVRIPAGRHHCRNSGSV